MALLSQLIPPEDLAKLTHSELLVLSDAVHTELSKNQDIQKALAPTATKMMSRLLSARKSTSG